MASVSFRKVAKTFGSVHAVRPTDLEIAAGEFVVLLGPSGCGKTTLLRMVAGLEEVTAGDLFIGDHRVNDLPARDRDVAMVFQNYALYPHLTVAENLAFPLRVRKIPRPIVAERVMVAARALGIADLLERKPRQLSGGQRQRVAVGRAIVRDPEVFLFDEPLSNLDAALRDEMRGELIRLHGRLGKTVIYVTHDQVEAMTMAQRIVVMCAGEIQQVAKPREVYEHPANLFVAGFVGSPKMTFIRGRLCKGSEGAVLEVATARVVLGHAAASDGAGEVIIGFRPEDVQLGDSPRAGHLVLPARVRSLQPLGATVLLDLEGTDEGWSGLAQLDWRACRVTAGDPTLVQIDAHAIHVFDSTTERCARVRPG